MHAFQGAAAVQVFIAAHMMSTFLSQYQSAVDICIAASIVVGNLADVVPTAAMLANSLKSVRPC